MDKPPILLVGSGVDVSFDLLPVPAYTEEHGEHAFLWFFAYTFVKHSVKSGETKQLWA